MRPTLAVFFLFSWHWCNSQQFILIIETGGPSVFCPNSDRILIRDWTVLWTVGCCSWCCDPGLGLPGRCSLVVTLAVAVYSRCCLEWSLSTLLLCKYPLQGVSGVIILDRMWLLIANMLSSSVVDMANYHKLPFMFGGKIKTRFRQFKWTLKSVVVTVSGRGASSLLIFYLILLFDLLIIWIF